MTVLDNGQVSFTSPIIALATSQSAFTISQSISASNVVGGQYYGVNITPTFFATTASQTETALRVAATFTGSAAAIGGQNIIADFGATSAGSQFTVTDVTSGSIYMVNDVSGLPIIEATSDWTVNMYNFPNLVFQKTGSQVNINGTLNVSGSLIAPSITGSLLGTASYATQALTASLALAVVGGVSAFPFTGSAQITGSLGVTGSITTSGSAGTINGLFIGLGTGNVATNISIGATTAFSSTMSGTNNTAIGRYSLLANTSGIDNTAIGLRALRYNTSGGCNVAIGRYALCANTTGANNIAIGNSALQRNTSGVHNVGLGLSALQYNTTGCGNIALSRNALISNTTGCDNVAIGRYGQVANSTGCHNI
jgi:hypothetical protein